MKTIVIEFDENGDMKIQTDGFKGDGCMKAVDALIGEMGGKKKNLKRKASFYQKKQQQPAYLKKVAE